MRIAILQCDDVLDKFQPDFGNYPQMIQSMLNDIEPTLEFSVFDVRLDQYPSSIDDWDLFITTGSKSSVLDNDAWIAQLLNFITILHYSDKKLFGICFGHQLIALA